MKRNAIKSIVCIILVALIGSYAVPVMVHAQATAAACDVDLSQATVLMTQAQAKASSGDTAGAMALLDQVTQQIKNIQARCGGGSVDLPQTYKNPNGLYTVNYPAGWGTEPLPGDPTQDHAILIYSDPTVYDSLMNNKPFGEGQGVVVYVGTAKQVAVQFGAGDSDKSLAQMTALSVLQVVIAGQTSSNGKVGTPQKTDPINDHETASATVTFNDPKTSEPGITGTLFVMQLDSDQFAVLLSLVGPDQPDTATAIARSMGASLKVTK